MSVKRNAYSRWLHWLFHLRQAGRLDAAIRLWNGHVAKSEQIPLEQHLNACRSPYELYRSFRSSPIPVRIRELNPPKVDVNSTEPWPSEMFTPRSQTLRRTFRYIPIRRRPCRPSASSSLPHQKMSRTSSCLTNARHMAERLKQKLRSSGAI